MNPRRLQSRDIEHLTLDTEPWLSCDDCFAAVDLFVEGLLDGDVPGESPMRAHLRGCPACAEEAATLAVLVAESTGRDPSRALAVIGH